MNWYRVELHTHTTASDGKMDPEELVVRAKIRNYDAIVLTDHNTTSYCQAAMAYGKKEGMLVIPGIEWTTFWGHILISGGKSNIDWRTVNLENIDEKLAEAKKSGDMVTIAHPKRLGTPFCSECRFLYKIKDWSNVDAYEVWSHYNPHIREESKKAIKEWSDLLNAGNKITPVYGYDWHDKDEDGPAYAYTYVGLEDTFNAENILQAIKDGHVYVSMGVNVKAEITKDDKTYYFGDEIEKGKINIKLNTHVSSDYKKRFDVDVKGVKVYKDGKMFLAKKWEGEIMDFDLELDCKNVIVVLYGAIDGQDCDLALMSPIYISEEKV